MADVSLDTARVRELVVDAKAYLSGFRDVSSDGRAAPVERLVVLSLLDESAEALSLLVEERDRLATENEAAYEAMSRILQGKPQENGQYTHLVYCNGDRRSPPGTIGVTCCCRIMPRDDRLAAENANLRDQNSKLFDGVRELRRPITAEMVAEAVFQASTEKHTVDPVRCPACMAIAQALNAARGTG